MKILYVCQHQLWPMNTGARLRNFHLSNVLGSDCSVTLLQILQPGEKKVAPTYGTNFQRILSVEKESSYTAGKLMRGLVGPIPVTILNYMASGVAKYLTSILNEGSFDSVQLVSIHLFGYLECIRSAPSRPVILLDWHNIESELMRRYAEATTNPAKRLVARRTASLLAQIELQALASFDAHTVVSEREKQKLLARSPVAKVHVIPNGVDTSAFHLQDAPSINRASLLFVGSMDYHANEEAVTWFVRQIWPGLSRSFPELNFTIVGRNPSVAVQALRSNTVKVTGTVDDVRKYYEAAFAVIVPLRVGGGTRLKILEAMAAGVPVISTHLGAEGLDVCDRVQILFADTGEQMHSAVTQLLKDGGLRSRLRDAGRKLVQDRYDWNSLGKQLESVHLATYRANG